MDQSLRERESLVWPPALEANLTQIKIFSRASPKLTGQLVCELGMVGQALLTLFE